MVNRNVLFHEIVALRNEKGSYNDAFPTCTEKRIVAL